MAVFGLGVSHGGGMIDQAHVDGDLTRRGSCIRRGDKQMTTFREPAPNTVKHFDGVVKVLKRMNQKDVVVTPFGLESLEG